MIVSLRCTTIASSNEGGGAALTPATAPSSVDGERIHAVAWAIDGSEILIASNFGTGCLLSGVDPTSGTVSMRRALSFCPDRISPLRDGSLLLVSGSMSLWLDAVGAPSERGQVVAAIDSRTYASRDSRGLVWVLEGVALRVETSLERVVMLAGGSVLVGVRRGERGESLVRVDRAGALTPISGDALSAIDSFDVAPDGKEVVISATREGAGSDVALISIDGGEANWIAPERFEETTATWAPRGSKVSWVVHSAGGSVVRTVHVPTGFQLTVDFPGSHVRTIAWEPRAERIAVVASEPFSSDRLDVLRYSGEDRRTLLPAAWLMDVALEPLPEAGAGVWVTSPAVVRYDERSPVVIWLDEPSDFAWKGRAAEVRAASDCGLVFTRSSLGMLDAGFWSALQSLPWFDSGRVFIVSRGRVSAAELAELDPRVIVIGPASAVVDAKALVEVPTTDDVDSYASGFLRSQFARPAVAP